MRLGRVLSVVAVFGMLAAACTSDEKDGAPPTSGPASTEPVSSASTSDAPIDTAAPETTAEPTTTAAPTTTTEFVPLPSTFPAPTGALCVEPDGGAAIITGDCVDSLVNGEPFIDVDEQQTTTDPATDVTVSYRYVHGGFTGSDVLFAYYFPSPDEYQGRFFESTYPTVGTEGASPDQIAFGISSGAYVVSSNNAGGVPAGLAGYRANAAAAKFSRVVAAQLYGADAPTRGYLYGGSGGAYQTIGSAENTDGVWDGFIPIIPGVPNAIPSFQGVQVLALRELQDKWPEIVDALEPGGSGDPYSTLNDDQRAILEEATRLGHPLRGWWQWNTLKGGAFGITVLAVNGIDGAYVNDFWNEPGYEGHDDPEVQALRVQFDTTLAGVEGTPPTSVQLTDTPTGFLLFADLVITSGAAAGKTINAVSIDGDSVTFPTDVDTALTSALAAGDQVQVDNSLWIGLEYYQRHQVPGAEFGEQGWDQYRDAAGNPLYPQRSTLIGHTISNIFGGIATGKFHGKMIMLASVLDVQAFPWSADWYRRQAQTWFGDTIDDNYRLWYLDNADHQPPATTEGYAHIVLYDSEIQQALLDLDAWVADDAPPATNTSYNVTDDNQVELTGDADSRGGVQPVVSLSVMSGEECDENSDDVRVDVATGGPVSFMVSAASPPDTGEIVRVEWDWESTGEFTDTSELEEAPSVQLCETHTYDAPGTYFAVVRVSSQREGDPDSKYRLVQNLARVRIVVNEQ